MDSSIDCSGASRAMSGSLSQLCSLFPAALFQSPVTGLNFVVLGLALLCGTFQRFRLGMSRTAGAALPLSHMVRRPGSANGWASSTAIMRELGLSASQTSIRPFALGYVTQQLLDFPADPSVLSALPDILCQEADLLTERSYLLLAEPECLRLDPVLFPELP
jgi:hypothetical protein